MIIYGVALLSICTLLGLLVGDVLGAVIGVKANVGGVGFAMLLLLVASEHLKRRGRFVPLAAAGEVGLGDGLQLGGGIRPPACVPVSRQVHEIEPPLAGAAPFDRQPEDVLTLAGPAGGSSGQGRAPCPPPVSGPSGRCKCPPGW